MTLRIVSRADPPALRVIGLHKLPFDAERFAVDVSAFSHVADVEFVGQIRENWENAWLVVIESDAEGSEIDFDAIWHGPARGPNAQAPWNERVVLEEPGRTVAAFYLHFVDARHGLGVGAARLDFPQPSAAAAWLWEKVPYTSPD